MVIQENYNTTVEKCYNIVKTSKITIFSRVKPVVRKLYEEVTETVLPVTRILAYSFWGGEGFAFIKRSNKIL